MSINNLSKRTYQPIGWKKDNKPIPEDHLTDIVECALNMPCALLTATEQANIKPYKLWIPHRELELENALSCASLWGLNQCQDQTFNNASTVLVYILKEPEHLADIDLSKNDYEFDDTKSHVGNDQIMGVHITKDWDTTKKLLIKKLTEEDTKRESMTYNDSPFCINPFTGWNAEHLAGLNLTIGLAMGAVSLRCRELGYFCQNYTAYRQTLTWHTKYKNKFQSQGKWFPYTMQVLGTSPEAVKISQTREFRRAKNHSESIFDPNDLHVDPMANAHDRDLERVDSKEYKKNYVENFPRQIPDYQINFFMDYYGRFNSDPKKLFKLAYSDRVKKWESFFNDGIQKEKGSK